jgi:hypothetical protein
MTIRYAVLLKVHYWDDFAERRLRHLLSKVDKGDVYVFVDETHGVVGKIAHDHVIRVTEQDLEKLGVLMKPPGQILWFNADYPLYYLYLHYNPYDYYLMCEHDTVFNIDVDEFVRIAGGDRVDYVASPLDTSFSRWQWRETCDGVYPESYTLHNWLNCISLHSRRSVEFLFERRKILTRRYTSGEITNWPYSEAFIPTEMKNNEFVVRELGQFGRVDRYTWWPPINEKDVPSLQDQAFLHPVLDERRYVASYLHRVSILPSNLLRDAELWRLLARSPLRYTVPNLIAALKRRVRQRAFGDVARP